MLTPVILRRNGDLAAVLPTVRTIPAGLRAAVMNRDEHCRFPDCAGGIDHIHHIRYYSQGGPTTIDNLIGLCHHHHSVIHTRGWKVTGDPGGTLEFADPAKSYPRPTTPPGHARHQRNQATREAVEGLFGEPPARTDYLRRTNTNPDPDPPF
jgi:hypothetical protein